MAGRSDREGEGSERESPKKSTLLCKTGMISMTLLDRAAMTNISIVTKKFGRSGNGRIGYMRTGWLESRQVIGIVMRKTTGR